MPLRQIVNLYITDGFYKASSNYMKSKLNSAELINLSRYFVYKIKTSSFQNLQTRITAPAKSQDPLEKEIASKYQNKW